jgi:hypothetical protein
MTPIPLPPNHPKLRDRRVEAWIGEPKPGQPGRYRMLAEGRFTNIEDAKLWADQEWPNAPIVTTTYFSARTGWTAQAVGDRIDGVWDR